MNILKSIPAQDGFRMPAEFEPHEGCILIWPERGDSWQYGAFAARKAFVQVAEAIAESEKVTVCASEAQYDTAREMLPGHIRVVEMSSNDSWARDYAPVFVVRKLPFEASEKITNGISAEENGVCLSAECFQRRGIDFCFNAWGGLVDGLYFPWDKDNKMARKLCDLYENDCYDARDFVLEGGSVHVDGQGTAMTTERCLLSAGRNPDMTKEQIEEKLKQYLNVEKVLWLPYGVYQDETNEHVDNICAFTAPGEVVLAWTDDIEDPQYAMSKADYEYLSSVTDARGRRLTIHKLPLPAPVKMKQEECEGLLHMDGEPTRTPGERLAASYVNFYISNRAVIMPAFHDPADERAKKILEGIFPDRKVVAVYARDILIGGGNIHCITQQVPGLRKQA